MKKTLIKVIKTNKYSFELAKRIQNRFNIRSVKNIENEVNFGYIMNNINELDEIKKHFQTIKSSNKRLWIFLTNNVPNNKIHFLFEKNVAVSFISIEYFKRYNKKLLLSNVVVLNHHEKIYSQELLEII